jgi:hypothetical protein
MAGADIGKGDFVEAIKSQLGEGCSITAGATYHVEQVYPPDFGMECIVCGPDSTGVGLVGQPHSAEGHWCMCAFRPIYRPKAELLESLLHDITAPSLEPA